MTLCEELPPQAWIEQRFSERCYWYPWRDCPGWTPASFCSRIEKWIPDPPYSEDDDGDAG